MAYRRGCPQLRALRHASVTLRTAISHRSVLAENANLHEQNRKLAQQTSDLE